MDARDYAEQAQEIFVLSDSFLRIKELIDDEQSTIDDIGEIILLDPALSGSILKLANSSLFNYQGKIDTISKAILVLGITEVYNLVIAQGVKDAFNKIQAEEEYLDKFWSQTVDCALIAKYIGTKLNLPNAERLFVLGLLHNLGELVVQQFSLKKREFCSEKSAKILPWLVQEKVLGFTYGECTAEILKLWQLPFSLVGPIREQDNADMSFATLETKLLYIAKRIAYLNHCSVERDLADVLDEKVLAAEQIDTNLLLEASRFCDMERLNILAILSPSAVTIY